MASSQSTYTGCSSSFPNVRTPFSNITNDLNIRTPLPNITNGYNQSYEIHTLFNSRSSKIHDNRICIKSCTTMSNVNTLSSGRHKLKRKSENVSPIPMVDLTSDEEVEEEESVTNIYLGKSKDYLDLGDQNVTSQKCNSKLWLDESLKGRHDHSKSSFSLCCSYGKVVLPDLKEPQHSYKNLYSDVGSKSNYFLKNIRRYNSIFSFTSMGGKIDKSINRDKAPWVFRLSGQNYHSIGSLLPQSGFKPKFSQLYIYDTKNEVTNRQSIFGDVTGSSKITDLQIIQQLKDMLDSENELVKCYRMVRDTIQQNPHIDVKLRLIGKRGTDGRTYNLPKASEVAALIVGDIGNSYEPRDIIVKS